MSENNITKLLKQPGTQVFTDFGQQYTYMPKDVKINKTNNLILFSNSETYQRNLENSSQTLRDFHSIKILNNDIYFRECDDMSDFKYTYTCLEMFIIKEKKLDTNVTQDTINTIQKKFREQITSLSNVFIIGQNRETKAFLCIFNPVRLNILYGEIMSPDDIDSKLTKNMIKNYS